MDKETIGFIGLAVMGIMLFLGLPVGVIMVAVGFVGVGFLASFDISLMMAQIVPYHKAADYIFSVVPLFFLMGNFAYHGGMGADFFIAGRKWLGHFPGGLAAAVTAACTMMAACTGSSMATAALMTRVALPEMRKANYAETLSTGVIAAAGTLAVLIPPSTIMVIYAIIVEESIGRLLMAGFLPGILESITYMILIFGMAKLNPRIAPPTPPAPWRERWASLKGIVALVAVLVLIIGGLFFGVFTPTECAAVGAFGVFIIALVRRRLSWQGFRDALLDTATITGTIFILLIGLTFFARFMALSGLATAIGVFFTTLPVHRLVILFMILGVYLILGCFLEGMSMMMLTLPTFYPLLMTLGFDGIWFGILVVKMIEIAAITPPVGVNVYTIKAVLGAGIRMETIFRGAVPFLCVNITNVIILVFWPAYSLILPSLMYGR